ncbi:RNA-binding protein [Clostridioides difficile]|nr:RNA-binding protein [Clostridioides difficile]
MAETEYRCFVGGLAWATDDQSLQNAFSKYGDVIDSKIITDRETGRSRGFGFVTFASDEAMRQAIEAMNGQDLDGRNITVNEAQSRRSGGGGGGGGYGGQRGGSGGYGGGGCHWGCCGHGLFHHHGCRCCARADEVPEPMYRAPAEVRN